MLVLGVDAQNTHLLLFVGLLFCTPPQNEPTTGPPKNPPNRREGILRIVLENFRVRDLWGEYSEQNIMYMDILQPIYKTQC